MLIYFRAYPLLSQGLGLTDPSRLVFTGSQPMTFKVLPQYVPGEGGGASSTDQEEQQQGKRDEIAAVLVASRPEIIVTLARKVVDLGGGGGGGQQEVKGSDQEEQILNWCVFDAYAVSRNLPNGFSPQGGERHQAPAPVQDQVQGGAGADDRAASSGGGAERWRLESAGGGHDRKKELGRASL